MINSPLDWLFYTVAVLFFMMSARMVWYLQWAQRLPSRSLFGQEQRSGIPKVSIVLAARDEAPRIESTVRRLLAQKEIELEIVVVNDRSTDGTADILRRLAVEDRRLKIVQVATLPPEWLGKCHACHLGAKAASGEWILFTDADCWLQEDVVIRALKVAAREKADHVTLTPGITPTTVGAAAWHLSFLLSVADWIGGVNRDEPKRFLGVGAFNLMKLSAYRTCGGYETLRLTVVDDIKLGLLLRRAGFRTRAFIGGDDALCDWGTTLINIIRIMEKNYFAAVDYRVGVVLGLMLIMPALWGSALLGLVAGSFSGIAAALGLLSLIIPAAIAARRLGWSLAPAFLTPIIFPAMFYAIFNSTRITLKQGGIKWRDTFYPLELLRRGNVRSEFSRSTSPDRERPIVAS